MTQLFGISKEKLDKIVADNPPSDSMGSNIYGMIASTIRNALVPIESEKHEYKKAKKGSFECICGDVLSSDKHFPIKKSYSIDDVDIPSEWMVLPEIELWGAGGGGDCTKCSKRDVECTCKAQEKKDLIHTAFHAIDEIKEERCTKCNCQEMSCKEDCTRKHTHKRFSCDECKEPRKEENKPFFRHDKRDYSIPDLHAIIDSASYWESMASKLTGDKIDLQAKLSRYKEALEEIDKYGKGVQSNDYRLDPKPYEIARTALEDTNH